MKQVPQKSELIGLFIIPTPIGNLSDISFRSIELLKQVDIIACEDTRTSSVLLQKYEISTPTFSFHQHNEHRKVDQIIQNLISGQTLALISDAGMPGISDPGFLLIRAARQANIKVTVVPGANAALTALVGSGFPCDRFIYEGFLPPKKGRKTRVESWLEEERSVIVYESVHRVKKLIDQIETILGPDRMIYIVRELTKKFEESFRGKVSVIKEQLEQHTSLKGEFVVVIAGKDIQEE